MFLVYNKLIFDGIDKWKRGVLWLTCKETIYLGQSIKYWEEAPHPAEREIDRLSEHNENMIVKMPLRADYMIKKEGYCGAKDGLG